MLSNSWDMRVQTNKKKEKSYSISYFKLPYIVLLSNMYTQWTACLIQTHFLTVNYSIENIIISSVCILLYRNLEPRGIFTQVVIPRPAEATYLTK